MTKQLAPYGSAEFAQSVAKVGKAKTPVSLAVRMPAPEIAAKVGIAIPEATQAFRVVRRSAQA